MKFLLNYVKCKPLSIYTLYYMHCNKVWPIYFVPGLAVINQSDLKTWFKICLGLTASGYIVKILKSYKTKKFLIDVHKVPLT